MTRSTDLQPEVSLKHSNDRFVNINILKKFFVLVIGATVRTRFR